MQKLMDAEVRNCGICQKEIILNVDNYIIISDYKNGQFLKKGYYHNKCWQEKFNEKKKLVNKTMPLINGAYRMLGIEDKNQDKEHYDVDAK